MALLADSAHGFGASYKGKMLGAVADGTVFSFHAVKNLTTAEGGAICLNFPDHFDHEEAYKWLCTMSLHGQNKDALAKTQKGAWRYDVIAPGYKCNMTDIQAAIGLVELSRYESETLPRRRAICHAYGDALAKYGWAVIPTFESDGMESSYHLYQLRIKGASEQQRDAIIAEIAESDVAVNVHFIPLPMLTAYRNLGYKMDRYPNALAQYTNEISLPLYYDLSAAQVAEVVRAVASAVHKVMQA
jgi:dTDP-4-amino-4,6-dideoxygalactose transaminase